MMMMMTVFKVYNRPTPTPTPPPPPSPPHTHADTHTLSEIPRSAPVVRDSLSTNNEQQLSGLKLVLIARRVKRYNKVDS